MRRRPSSRATATAAIVIAALVVAGCEARVYGTPPADPDTPQLTVVAPQGNTLRCRKLRPTSAVATVRRPRRQHQTGQPPMRRSPVPISRSSCWTATPARSSRAEAAHLPDRLGGEAVHRRRPAVAGVQGPDDALPCRPQGRSTSCCGPPTTARPRTSGTAAAETPSSPASRRGTGWRARRRRRTGTGTSPPAPQAISSATTTCCSTAAAGCHPSRPTSSWATSRSRRRPDRRLPAAFRYPRGALRRARRGQAGLVLLLERRQPVARLHRRDRSRPPLRDGDQIAGPDRAAAARDTITQFVKTMFPGGKI